MANEKDPRYSKVEQEILEILNEVDDREPPPRPSNVVKFRKRRRNPLSGMSASMPSLKRFLGTVTPAKLLGATLLFAIAAIFAQGISGALSLVLVLAAVVAFLALFFVRSGPKTAITGGRGPGSPRVKRWRGRDIVLEPRDESRSGRWKRFLPGRRH